MSRRGVTRISASRREWEVGVTALILCLAVSAPASAPLQTAFSYDALTARMRMPVVREHSYVVNAKVRPLLAFWIGRDNIGDACLTWREAPGGHRTSAELRGLPVRAVFRPSWWMEIELLLDRSACNAP